MKKIIQFIKEYPQISIPIILFILLLVIAIVSPCIVEWFFGDASLAEKTDTLKKTQPIDILKFIGLTCGALIILFQLHETNKRNRNMEQQLAESNVRNKNMAKANAIAERGQVNTRFKDAAMLLGGTQTASILSGIYALHQIAVEAAKGDTEQKGYVKTIHEILCSYLRENSTTQPASQTICFQAFSNNKPQSPISPAERVCTLPAIVVQTIVDVLFKNKGDIYGDYETDLTETIFEDIDFSKAVLRKVRFNGATLNKTRFILATLNDTRFDNATLNDTRFDNATLNNTGFVFATLNKTEFRFATLNKTEFNYATLNKTEFNHAKLNNTGFNRATLNNTSFSGAALNNTWFYRARINNTDFYGATLNNTWFNGATLKDTEFERATLNNTWFNSAKLNNTTFKGSTLTNVAFIVVALERIDFSHSKDENGKIVKQTTLEDVDFTKTVLAGYSYDEIIAWSMELTTPPPSSNL